MARGKSVNPAKRAKIVKAALRGMKVPVLAEKYNVNAGTIYNWVSRHNSGEVDLTVTPDEPARPRVESVGKVQALQAEIIRLKAELYDLKFGG